MSSHQGTPQTPSVSARAWERGEVRPLMNEPSAACFYDLSEARVQWNRMLQLIATLRSLFYIFIFLDPVLTDSFRIFLNYRSNLSLSALPSSPRKFFCHLL